MPDVTVTLTAPQLSRWKAAMKDIYGYAAYVADGSPGGLTENQWIRREHIQRAFKDIVRDSEARIARKTAEQGLSDLGDVT